MRTFLFSFLLFVFNTYSQQLEVEVYPPFAVKGDAVSIIVKADVPIRIIEGFPEIENWRSSGIRQGSQTINGVSSYYFLKQYVPDKEGDFTFPSFKVNLNGKVTQTPEKKIKILPDKTIDDEDKIIFTKIRYNGKDKMPERIYPGVLFTVDYEVSVVRGWRYLDQNALYDYRPQLRTKDLHVQTYSSFLENKNYQDSTKFTMIDEIPYQTTVYSYKMAPMKSGTYDFTIKQRVIAVKKIPGIARNKTQQKDIDINETINVTPIPSPPPGVYFLEIAGDWEVDAKLSRSSAKTGHTFELQLYVKGEGGDIERIKAPDLKLPGFEVDSKPEIQHHKFGAIIKYSMRALKKTDFPEITFATFNHLTEKFERFPFSLDIDISGQDISVNNNPGNNETAELNQNTDKPGLKIDQTSISRPLHFNISPLWYLLTLTFPLIYLAIIWFYRRAEMGQETDPKKEAIVKLKNLCVKLENNSESEFFDKELLPCLAQAYELPPGATADELAAKIDDKELAVLIQNSSHQSFLPGNQQKLNNSALAAKIKKVLLTLSLFLFTFSASADDSYIIKSYENGDYYAVIEGYKKLIKKDNSRPGYFYNMGLAQMNLENYPEALASFETASKLSPADNEIRDRVIFVRNKLQLQKANDLFSVRDKLRPDQWLKTAMTVWVVFWLILIVQLIRKIPGKRWTAVSGTIIFLGCILAYITQMSSTYKEGQYIITQKISIAENELIPGEEISSLKETEDKVRISFKNKEVWIEKSKLAKVW